MKLSRFIGHENTLFEFTKFCAHDREMFEVLFAGKTTEYGFDHDRQVNYFRVWIPNNKKK